MRANWRPLNGFVGTFFRAEPCSRDKCGFEIYLSSVPRRFGVHISKNDIAFGCKEAIEVSVFRSWLFRNITDGSPRFAIVRGDCSGQRSALAHMMVFLEVFAVVPEQDDVSGPRNPPQARAGLTTHGTRSRPDSNCRILLAPP